MEDPHTHANRFKQIENMAIHAHALRQIPTTNKQKTKIHRHIVRK